MSDGTGRGDGSVRLRTRRSRRVVARLYLACVLLGGLAVGVILSSGTSPIGAHEAGLPIPGYLVALPPVGVLLAAWLKRRSVVYEVGDEEVLRKSALPVPRADARSLEDVDDVEVTVDGSEALLPSGDVEVVTSAEEGDGLTLEAVPKPYKTAYQIYRAKGEVEAESDDESENEHRRSRRGRSG